MFENRIGLVLLAGQSNWTEPTAMSVKLSRFLYGPIVTELYTIFVLNFEPVNRNRFSIQMRPNYYPGLAYSHQWSFKGWYLDAIRRIVRCCCKRGLDGSCLDPTQI